MKNTWLILGAAMALAAVSVQATPITGEIDMSGTATLNSINLGTATGATSFSGVSVGGGPTGAFAGTTGATVSWNAFTWPGGSANPLWTFTLAGLTYTFALSSDSVVAQSSTFLNLLGVGTLSITGAGSTYTPTTADWSFTISNPTGGNHANFDFTFANSQTGAGTVPDGAATAMLLGTALSALALLRKKLMA
jgi:hypothetical protein